MQFYFSDHTLDTERRELRRGAEAVSVEPQVFDLLAYLVQNRDRVVSKDDLIASVWSGRIVSDSTLTSRINAARRAIGNDTGPMHLLVAAGCPATVLYSIASDPALTAPRGRDVRILRSPALAELAVEEVAATLGIG